MGYALFADFSFGLLALCLVKGPSSLKDLLIEIHWIFLLTLTWNGPLNRHFSLAK